MTRFTPSPARGRWTHVALLDADPELAEGMDAQRGAEARRALVVRRVAPMAKGWDDDALDRLVGDGMGALLLTGVVARELAMSDNVTTEILGPGDLLVSSHVHDPGRLLRAAVRWTVIEPPTFALLSRAFAEALAPFPEITMQLMSRLAERAHRLSVAQAISQLNGVDRRILTMLWQLAERWGHVRADGVHVPLCLPHRMLAELIGARRPTVSTAVASLIRDGEVRRLEDGGWLLVGEPVGLPTGDASRVIHMRHRRSPDPAPVRSEAG